MPTYDYVCRKCNKKFSVLMSMSEHGKKKVKCLKCSSADVARTMQPFFATTSKKS